MTDAGLQSLIDRLQETKNVSVYTFNVKRFLAACADRNIPVQGGALLMDENGEVYGQLFYIE